MKEKKKESNDTRIQDVGSIPIFLFSLIVVFAISITAFALHDINKKNRTCNEIYPGGYASPEIIEKGYIRCCYTTYDENHIIQYECNTFKKDKIKKTK